MKKCLFFIAVIALLYSTGAITSSSATTPSELVSSLAAKLEAWDVEGIWPEVLEALAQHPHDAALLEKAASIAYYRGDYQEALNLMKRSQEGGGEDKHRR